MASLRKSLAISFAEKYSTILIQFFTTVILARILTPEDIGIFSVGVVIVGLAHTFRDFGVSHYLVQEKELTKERIRTAFGLTLIIAWTAAIILISSAGLISSFYNEPGVKEVLYILALSFFFIPFSSTILGLLRREMNFEKILVINLASTIANTAISLSLAYMGYGFISLAWGTMASALITVVAGVVLRPKESQFIPSFKEFNRIFSFGSYTSGATIIQELGISTPDLAIGRNLGFSSLGLYSRGVGLVSIFNYAIAAAINPIISPYFAKLTREGTCLKEPYLRSIEYFTVIAWPFFLFLGIFPDKIILILYGEQWLEAGNVVRILCIAYAIRSILPFAGHYLLSIGEVKTYFKIQFLIQPPNMLLIIVTSFISIEAVASSQIIYFLICLLVYNRYTHHHISTTLHEILIRNLKSLYVTTLSMAPIAIVLSAKNYQEINTIWMVALSFIYAVSYIASLFIFKHDLSNEIKSLLNQKKAS